MLYATKHVSIIAPSVREILLFRLKIKSITAAAIITV